MVVLKIPRVDLFKDFVNVAVCPTCVLFTGNDPYGVFLVIPSAVISKINSETVSFEGSS